MSNQDSDASKKLEVFQFEMYFTSHVLIFQRLTHIDIMVGCRDLRFQKLRSAKGATVLVFRDMMISRSLAKSLSLQTSEISLRKKLLFETLITEFDQKMLKKDGF